MRYLRYILVILVVSVAAWQLAPHFKDFKQIYELRNKINYFWLTLALLSQSGQYIGDGWLSKILLKVTSTHMSFKNTVKIASMNVFSANLLPVGQAGAMATAYYFYKKLGVTNQNFIFLSLSWTAITTSTLFGLFIFSLITLHEIPTLGFSYKGIALTVFITILVIAILSYISRTIVWPRVKHLIIKTGIYAEFVTFKKNFPIFKAAIIKNKADFYNAFIAALIFYFSSIAILKFSFLTFGVHIPIPVAILAYSLSLFAGWVTLAPAGIGTTEATMILIFLQFNFAPPEVLASVLLFRIINFWLPIPIGALAYFSLRHQTRKRL